MDRRGTARLWSAAAATGEEPYSLAMALIDIFQRNNLPVTILATDVDADALAVASEANMMNAPCGPQLDGAKKCRVPLLTEFGLHAQATTKSVRFQG